MLATMFAGKAANGRVEALRGLVVALALDGDPVLRSFELRLQLEEVLVRLQLRDSARRRRAGATARCSARPARLRTASIACGSPVGSAAAPGAPPGATCPTRARALTTASSVDFSKFAAPCTVRHEVRDQVEAPLVLALDLRPLLIDLLVERDEVVARDANIAHDSRR